MKTHDIYKLKTARKLINEQVFTTRPLTEEQFTKLVQEASSEVELMRTLMFKAPTKTAYRIHDIIISFDWEL